MGNWPATAPESLCCSFVVSRPSPPWSTESTIDPLCLCIVLCHPVLWQTHPFLKAYLSQLLHTNFRNFDLSAPLLLMPPPGGALCTGHGLPPYGVAIMYGLIPNQFLSPCLIFTTGVSIRHSFWHRGKKIFFE